MSTNMHKEYGVRRSSANLEPSSKDPLRYIAHASANSIEVIMMVLMTTTGSIDIGVVSLGVTTLIVRPCGRKLA
jgi:hypothetical protein